MKLLKCRKGLSPVVAAIILIAVTVAVSIAVAAWMGALTITFMATEQLSFTGCDYEPELTYANLTIKNTGTSALTIDRILINGYAGVDGWTVQGGGGADKTLDPAEEVTIRINASAYPTAAGITSDNRFSQGDSYAFTVVTTKNNQFGPYTTLAQPS